MKPMKDFDSVQMKWDIQQKLLEEARLLGKEEARRRQDERVRNHSVLGSISPAARRTGEAERQAASPPVNRAGT